MSGIGHTSFAWLHDSSLRLQRVITRLNNRVCYQSESNMDYEQMDYEQMLRVAILNEHLPVSRCLHSLGFVSLGMQRESGERVTMTFSHVFAY